MKTRGEIEAAVSKGMGRFEQEFAGRGPRNVQSHLVRDLIVVRLQGVLTAAEQALVKSAPGKRGRELVKRMRTELMETARPVIEAMIREVSGVHVVSLNHDINPDANEQIVVFVLAATPDVREATSKPTAPKVSKSKRSPVVRRNSR